MAKRFLSLVLSALLLLSLLPSAFAADEGTLNIQHSYSNNGYTFEKVSHASEGTETKDGVVDYLGNKAIAAYEDGVSETGNGDGVQSYSYCAAAYGDWVYMGTMYGALSAYSQVQRSLTSYGVSSDEATAIIDAMYNGKLNKGREDDGYYAGSVFFKFNVKTGETKILMSRDLYDAGECDGVPIFRAACAYNGKLYFVGFVSDGSALEGVNYSGYTLTKAAALNLEIMYQSGIPGIYEVDPADDSVTCVYECVSRDDYLTLCASMNTATMSKSVFTSTRAIGTFKDYLVAAGLQVGDGATVRDDGYVNGEAVIYATNNPASGDFKVIATMDDLLDYPAIWRDGSSGGGGIYQVIEYNDSLYVAIVTGTKATQDATTGQFRPFALIRGDYDASKGAVDDAAAWAWTPVIGDQENDGARYTFGIDPARTASGACTLQVYGGYLYIGEYNDVNGSLNGILTGKQFTTLAENLKQSINLYRMDTDENIELVVGDATDMFPQGGISGWGSGYETHMTQYTWQTTEYDGIMYLSTMDETSLLHPIAQFTNGELLNMSRDEWVSQFNYLRALLKLMVSGTDSVSTLSVGEDAETFSVLTDAQRQSLTGLVSGGSLKTQLTALPKLLSALQVFTTVPFELASLVETTDIQSFYEGYSELVESYLSIRDLLPESVQPGYDMIMSFATRENFSALLTCLSYMKDSEAGFDLYAIEQADDGSVDITTVTTDGFGDRYNHGLRTFAATTDYLVVGTANPFYGTQLWRMAATPDSATEPEKPAWSNPFKDLISGRFYTDAVLWAVNQTPQIVCGTTDTTFSPGDACTRAQVVTFLWRAMGCPTASRTNTPFTDVNTSAYYYPALLWAYENGIVAGTSDTTFSPNATVTRGQVVTFLYRAAKQPSVTGTTAFTDLRDDAFYADAVLWAVNQTPQIVCGTTDTTFSPDDACTRGQVVTFLYRYLGA